MAFGKYKGIKVKDLPIFYSRTNQGNWYVLFQDRTIIGIGSTKLKATNDARRSFNELLKELFEKSTKKEFSREGLF